MDDETKVVLCAKLHDDWESVPGSEIRWCHVCATTLIVSPEGLALTGDVRFTCDDCFIGLTEPKDIHTARDLREGLTDEEVRLGHRWLEKYLARKRMGRRQ